MNKKEVQQLITRDGRPLALNRFRWDEDKGLLTVFREGEAVTIDLSRHLDRGIDCTPCITVAICLFVLGVISIFTVILGAVL